MPSTAHILLRDYAAEYAALDPIRRELHFRVDLYFKSHVRIEERAFQWRELTPEEGTHRLAGLWHTALLLYPSLAGIIERAFPSQG